jgi:hypothetical protein
MLHYERNETLIILISNSFAKYPVPADLMFISMFWESNQI